MTESIAKAMYTVHNITYAEYVDSLDKRMEVEKAREADYTQARRVVADAS